jgi:dihydrodipicolinate synthase/N-acetylneuraminate lyase
MMKLQKLEGVLPVLHVPYHEDFTPDYETFRRQIDWAFACGVDGVVLAMVTDILRLTDAERDALVVETVQAVAGRGPVVASAGAESTQQAVRHAKAAEAAGVTALMVIPPGLTRCSPAQITAYYEAILGATKLPVIIQDASGYVGNPIPVATQAALFLKYPDRVLFKPEAQPIGQNLSALRDATGGKAPIFEGTGGIALADSFRRGIVGTMPGTDVCWAIVALWRALQAGREAEANRIHLTLSALIALQHSLDAFLAIEKLLLVEQGIFKNTLVRGPLGFELDAETKAEALRLYRELKRIVSDIGEKAK